MKKVILSSFLFFFISSVSYSQSKLPECKPTDKVLYHNCYGKKIYGRKGDTENPRGGVRGVIKDKQSY